MVVTTTRGGRVGRGCVATTTRRGRGGGGGGVGYETGGGAGWGGGLLLQQGGGVRCEEGRCYNNEGVCCEGSCRYDKERVPRWEGDGHYDNERVHVGRGIVTTTRG